MDVNFESLEEAIEKAKEIQTVLKIRMSVIEADGLYRPIATDKVWEGCRVVAEFADILYMDYMNSKDSIWWGIYITE